MSLTPMATNLEGYVDTICSALAAIHSDRLTRAGAGARATAARQRRDADRAAQREDQRRRRPLASAIRFSQHAR